MPKTAGRPYCPLRSTLIRAEFGPGRLRLTQTMDPRGFMVHRAEQLRRFKARRQTAHKQWKITEDDWRNRKKLSPLRKSRVRLWATVAWRCRLKREVRLRILCVERPRRPAATCADAGSAQAKES